MFQRRKFFDIELNNIKESDKANFKHHDLPLARIKKIMKSDDDVRMIGSDAPILFSKACELFIFDLTMLAQQNADKDKRKTLQRSDIIEAIRSNEMFDFLIDIVSNESNNILDK